MLLFKTDCGVSAQDKDKLHQDIKYLIKQFQDLFNKKYSMLK